MERVRGIEPLSSAWKAVIIPLYYTRNSDYCLIGKENLQSPNLGCRIILMYCAFQFNLKGRPTFQVVRGVHVIPPVQAEPRLYIRFH